MRSSEKEHLDVDFSRDIVQLQLAINHLSMQDLKQVVELHRELGLIRQ